MLDMGFIHDVKKIIAKLPQKRQTLFFSATMPPEIQKLADVLLKDPIKVEVTPPASTVDKIEQSLYYVGKNEKPDLLLHLLKDAEIKTALVFTRTKHGADKVVKELSRVGVGAEAIHGNKSQNARQRALSNFKSGHTRVLVATDIAARGIDVDDLSHVINFELPNVPETYVHRIGRTGRANTVGQAITFMTVADEYHIAKIEKMIRMEIPRENLPEDLDIMKTPVDERQMMLREIDNQKRKEDPTFLGAFHEKKNAHLFKAKPTTKGKDTGRRRTATKRTKRK